MQQPIKWGVLGYARIAHQWVIPAIVCANNAVPYAIASRSEDKLQEAKERFGFEKLYSSYEALLEDPDVQAVYIPLPNGLHKEWAIKAAQHGKHVLCEKPLALTAADCEEIAAAARENKVKVMEAFMYRYTARTKKVQELLKAGVIGEIKHISSTFRIPLTDKGDVRMDPTMGGGSLWDVGCYPINFIGMFTQEHPEDFCVLKREEQGVDISLSAVLRYKSGIIATVNSGFDSCSLQLTEINGTNGTILLRDTFVDKDTPVQVFTGREKSLTEYPVEVSERYVLEVEDFSAAVLEDREPLFSMEETIRNNGLIDELLKAAK